MGRLGLGRVELSSLKQFVAPAPPRDPWAAARRSQTFPPRRAPAAAVVL